MYDHILVPLDGSDHANKALQSAIDLSLATGGKGQVTVIHVNPIVHLVSELGVTVDVDQLLSDEGQRIVEPAVRKVKDAAISCDSVTLKGDPAHEICKTANSGDFDLIIMGSRGLGDFSEMILGGVSHKVIHNARCPVMVVK